jgi:hypothetical protein
MGNPFNHEIIQIGIRVPLNVNIKFDTINDIIKKANEYFLTNMGFTLYNGFYNSFSKNKLIINEYNKDVLLNENENMSLKYIREQILNLQSDLFSNLFFFGGVFIFIEKFK